jgi:acyl carrier protein
MRPELKKLLAEALDLAEAAIAEDGSMETVPGWDSVAHLNIVLSIEGQYGVSFTPEEMLEMTSLTKICSALTKRGVVST